MASEDKFKYRHTLTLPSADHYFVDDVLDLISNVKFPCSHPDPAENIFQLSGTLKHTNTEQNNDNIVKTATHNRNEIINESYSADRGENLGLIQTTICDQCLGMRLEHKKYLIKRLLKSVNERKFELWNIYKERVLSPPRPANRHFLEEPDYTTDNFQPPIDYKDPVWWARMALIEKYDVIAFCDSERIKVVFESDISETDSNTLHPNKIPYFSETPHKPESNLNKNQQPPSTLQDSKKQSSDAVERTTNISGEDYTKDSPPGKLPRTLIGQLAIQVAWEIEKELGRPATVTEVIARLQNFVTTKRHSDIISIIPQGVEWITSSCDEKEYKKDACRHTLKTWHKSRKIK